MLLMSQVILMTAQFEVARAAKTSEVSALWFTLASYLAR